MDKIFFEEEVDLGLDLLKIIIDDHLLEDNYDNYNCLKDDHEFYLEPFLIAHYHLTNLKKLPLDQILLGYFKDKIGIKKIEVVSDNNGVIYLPEIGCLLTGLVQHSFFLKATNDYEFILVDKKNNRKVDFKFEKLELINNSNIEILKYSNEYIHNKIFNTPTINLKTKNIEVDFEKKSRYSTILNKAFDLIKKVDKQQYFEIQKLVKRVVFFDCGYFVNFTSMDFQGNIFISTYDTAKRLTFVDTLIHETSHLSLNLILINTDDYFKIDPFELKFNSPFFEKSIKRGLYHSLHATYVLTKLVIFYNKLYDSEILEEVENYELLGLFLLDIELLGEAISYIDDKNLYTEKGIKLFEEMKKVYNKIYTSKKHLVDTYKLPKNYRNSNAAVTPKNFQIDDFIKINNLSIKAL